MGAGPRPPRSDAWPLKVTHHAPVWLPALEVLAGLRRWRPRTLQFAEEEAWVERWLDLVERTLAVDPAAAREVVATAALVRGYADTYKRGLANWSRIVDAQSSSRCWRAGCRARNSPMPCCRRAWPPARTPRAKRWPDHRGHSCRAGAQAGRAILSLDLKVARAALERKERRIGAG